MLGNVLQNWTFPIYIIRWNHLKVPSFTPDDKIPRAEQIHKVEETILYIMPQSDQ